MPSKKSNITTPSITYTLTFGDQAENHVGMEKRGKMADNGFSVHDLQYIISKLERNNQSYQLIDLTENLSDELRSIAPAASVLYIPNGANFILSLTKPILSNLPDDIDDIAVELGEIEFDTKYYCIRTSKIKNKIARHCICLGDDKQDADFSNAKGTVIAWDDVPVIKKFHSNLKFFGQKAENLQAEGNKYYDINNTGIGYHGDSERKIVIALRVGQTLPLHYQWYQNSKPVGNNFSFNVNHGDIYIMSEKAVGTDWLKRNPLTLRHAAGCAKYTNIKK